MNSFRELGCLRETPGFAAPPRDGCAFIEGRVSASVVFSQSVSAAGGKLASWLPRAWTDVGPGGPTTALARAIPVQQAIAEPRPGRRGEHAGHRGQRIVAAGEPAQRGQSGRAVGI